jgi:iron complex transport system permease protein
MLLVSLGLNVALGSVKVPWKELVAVLASRGSAEGAAKVLWEIRLPRALAAAFGGAALAASGLLLQIFFRNPIVDPFVLGISSGATLAVAAVLMAGLSLGGGAVSPWLLHSAALLGATAVLGVVVAVAGRVKSAVTLLLIGLMIGYLCSAGSNILIAVAEKEKVHAFVLWTLGSFSGFRWEEVSLVAGSTTALLAGAYLLCKPLNALLLGEEYARSMGVNLRAVRVLLVLLASSLAAIVTAFAGPVAFVGLAAPHLARLMLGTSDNRYLIPAAALMGAIVTSACDLVARLSLSPVELPLSAVTALFGAPLVITFLLRRRTTM